MRINMDLSLRTDMDPISENKAGQGVLPPVPVFEIPCEKCTGAVPLEEGKIPVRCPHCGYYLRPENDSMWSHFCFVLRHRYASWKGRCTRKEIWSFILFSHLILLLPAFLCFLILDSRVPSCSCAAGHAGPFYIAILIATIIYIPFIGIPQLFLFARRLHDIGMSGIPVLVHIVLLGLLICSSFYLAYYSSFAYEDFQSVNVHQFDTGWIISLVLTYVLSMGLEGLKLFFFIISFLDSKRGTNKYGPSRKYPLCV